MATASKIQLSASQTPQFHVANLRRESATKASELLQINHEKHHIFFNQDGFHNHIAHHLLTLFALGGTPAQLQSAYDHNASYQRAPEPLQSSIVSDMHEPSRFQSYFGQEKYYHDFLVFFQEEINKKGWEATVQEYLFAETELADDMLARLYAGFLHPLIHLGFGVEFEQPGVIAEALAQAAVHGAWMKGLFLGCEEKVRERGEAVERKTIVQVLEECRNNEKMRAAAQEGDANKIRDGILKRAPKEMVDMATQCFVKEGDDLQEKMAEMVNAAGMSPFILLSILPLTVMTNNVEKQVYFTITAPKPPHIPKLDFFYMHCLNASIFFPRFLATPSFSPHTQRRLLNWKIWSDITMYVSRGCPPLLPQEVSGYKPKKEGGLDDVIERVKQIDDDGHAAKLVRAIANAERVCKEWEGREGFEVKGEMWEKVGLLAVESLEAGAPEWVRGCGFEGAWEGVPLREGGKL
ncbi:hypothetical protein CFE70_006479 [Pyrenophora teres f. teres 0-1]|uniref:DUF4243 domain containing protein n=1 Tax=Pyrenophora teres f. teres (strain 0-1) TaxID=861557 RepID=E3S870_PYRTT|nr:hypothetical protein PTT_19102 [Pyrenophora teres f. teres 0-1]